TCALPIWGFFQASVQLGSGSLLGNAELITKIWFPRELIPAASVLAQTISLAVIFAILVPLDIVFVPETARTMPLVIPFVAAFICLALGFAWLFSVANVFFRDIEHLLAVIFLPWFFLTPILYGLDQLPAAAEHQWLIDLMRYGNPVTPYVEGIRAVTLQATVPGTALLTYICAVGPALAAIGLCVLPRSQARLAVGRVRARA